MSVKIMGGSLKGVSLCVPKGDLIRPTSVLLKRRFFDSVQSFDRKVFIDLCCGSGSIGIEALSRGAKRAILVESSFRVLPSTKKNVEFVRTKLDDPSKLELIRSDAIKYFKSFVSCIKNNITHEYVIFFDPPYAKHELYREFLELIFQTTSENTQYWIESDSKKGLGQEELSGKEFDILKTFKQGDSFIIHIQKKYTHPS